MTDQELIERLRWRKEKLDANAADRIEELVKERDGYLAERNKFQLYLQRTHADWELEVTAVDALNAKLAKAVERSEQGWATAKAAVDRGMDLERKLAKAAEALREILMKPRSIDQTYVELWADTIKEVRAVLAELDGNE